ncbi:MAG: hypothetical protein J1E33_00310, partial [Alistipes sp.]|nr:hypothetical protein [Alistipes sp.]
MKSIYKPLLFIAALFATTACSNVDDEGLTPDTPVRTKRLTVNTTSDDDETRVVIGQLTDGKYPVLWENEGETLTLIEYDEQTDTYDTYDSDECSVLYNGKQASFSFNNFKEKEGNSFSYNAFSPACDFIKIDEDHCVEFTLPEVQK